MFLKIIIVVLFFTFFSSAIFGQKDSVNIKIKKGGIYNPLAPSKAAFYAAIFPGMGQVYNKKYWKVPIAWASIGIPTYFYITQNRAYQRYRTAYKLRKNNLIDEFTVNDVAIISLETLERAQEQFKENRDLSLMFIVIMYVVQIVEASVNAHLLQFNTDDNLSFNPTFINNPIYVEAPKVGLTIKYNF